MFNLLDSQRGSLTRMLQLSESSGPTETWKVLVYDKAGQEILAPLLKVGALRSLGVTLHLPLHSDRQAIPGVPVVYFMDPSEANLTRLVSDLSGSLYESVYVNFTSSISKVALQGLASRLSPPVRIAQIVDRCSSFVCLGPQAFSLGLPGTYSALHVPHAIESEISSLVNRIVENLFSVIVATRQVPVIRAAPGEAAEMVGRALGIKIREFIASGGVVASELSLSPKADALGGSAGRPVLVLLDRDVDLASPLAHTWGYQPLLHDALGMKSGRVKLQNGKEFDVDGSNDQFYQQFASAPFPAVATALNEQLADFNKKRQEISEKNGSLTAAIDALPQLSDWKRSLDLHTGLATALLGQIGARKLDRLFEWELEVARKGVTASLTDLEAIVADVEDKKMTSIDKVRAVLVMALKKSKELTPAHWEQLTKAIANEDLSHALKYLKYIASVKSMGSTVSSAGASSSGAAGAGGALVRGLLSAGMANIKNILPSKEELPVTKIVEELVNNDPQQQTKISENFVYVDPRAPEGSVRYRGVFRAAIVCIIGGANFVEMQNVHEAASKAGRTVLYGGTDFVAPSDLANELAAIGKML